MVVIKTLNTKGGEGAVDQRGGGGLKCINTYPFTIAYSHTSTKTDK